MGKVQACSGKPPAPPDRAGACPRRVPALPGKAQASPGQGQAPPDKARPSSEDTPASPTARTSPDRAGALRRAEAPPCPHCGHCRVWRHGHFRLKGGGQQERYRCTGCGRTFNRLTGTPLAYLKKRDRWPALLACMAASLPVRQTASWLQVHPETAFAWRHRLLGALPPRPSLPLTGEVHTEVCYFRYSEKGQRRPVPPPAAPFQRHRSIHQKMVAVLLARAQPAESVALVLGRGRPTPQLLADTLKPMVGPGAVVHSGSLAPFGAACQAIGVPFHGGPGALAGRWATLMLGKLHDWIRRFRGVATRYLPNYLVWFRSLCRPRPLWADHLLCAA